MDDELEAARATLRAYGVADEVIHGASRNSVFRLAYEQYLWGAPAGLTAADMGRRTGFDESTVRRLWVRLGFPDPGERTVFREADEVTFRLAHAGAELFGIDEIDAFALVVGMAVRRITDAASALSVSRLDDMGLTLSERLDQGSVATTLLRSVAEDMLPLLLLHNLEAVLEFSAEQEVEGGGHLSVGFCDLAGSTVLLNSADPRGVLDALAHFQFAANDIVVRHRGLVVKFVGDEVLFGVATPAAAIAIGRELLDWVAGNSTLDSARVGCAVGDVVQRDGDLFGPTVNRAARLVALAPPGSLLVDAAMTDEGVQELVKVRGFNDPVPVRALTADGIR
jgi:adenylate cyclase